jgi:hypothetical protein
MGSSAKIGLRAGCLPAEGLKGGVYPDSRLNYSCGGLLQTDSVSSVSIGNPEYRSQYRAVSCDPRRPFGAVTHHTIPTARGGILTSTECSSWSSTSGIILSGCSMPSTVTLISPFPAGVCRTAM